MEGGDGRDEEGTNESFAVEKRVRKMRRCSSTCGETLTKEGKIRFTCKSTCWWRSSPWNRSQQRQCHIMLSTAHSDANIVDCGERPKIAAFKITRKPVSCWKSNIVANKLLSLSSGPCLRPPDRTSILDYFLDVRKVDERGEWRTQRNQRSSLTRTRSLTQNEMNSLLVANQKCWLAAITASLLWATVKIGWWMLPSPTHLD